MGRVVFLFFFSAESDGISAESNGKDSKSDSVLDTVKHFLTLPSHAYGSVLPVYTILIIMHCIYNDRNECIHLNAAFVMCSSSLTAVFQFDMILHHQCQAIEISQTTVDSL